MTGNLPPDAPIDHAKPTDGIPDEIPDDFLVDGRFPHRVVRASAGSGKTYQLTSDYLRLLYMGSREPGSDAGEAARHILATTFTRKAAGEILERVLTRLADAAQHEDKAREVSQQIGHNVTTAACRNMLAELCAELHRVSIGTLDSFFNRVAMSFRMELGIVAGAQVATLDDPRVVQLRRRAIAEVLSEHDPFPMIELLQRLHHDEHLRSVTGAIEKIVRTLYDHYRDAPESWLWDRLDLPAGHLETAELQSAKQRLRLLSETPQNKPWAKALRNNREAADADRWEDFLDSGIAKKIVAGEPKFSSAMIGEEVLDVYWPLVHHARHELLRVKHEQNTATFELLACFDKHFTRLRESHGILLYADLPHKLANVLPKRERLLDEVYYRLDAKVTHLLLDEHQDTSLKQWDVIRPFAQEIASHADGSRSLTLVGDVKQAIYGWRGGCSEIFDLLKDDLPLPDHAWTDLNVSWRSSPTILEACNELFATLGKNQAFDEPDRPVAQQWAARYQPHQAQHSDKPGYVELATSGLPPDAEEGEDARTPDHMAFVARRVQDIVSRSPGCDIGVLCRTNKAVNKMLQTLHQLGIKASGEAGNPITDDPAVVTVLSALTMADHPGHSAAVFRVLHSPLAGPVGLRSNEPMHVDTVALNIRHRLLAEGYSGVLADWSQQLAPHADERSVIRLTQLVELADHYDPALSLRPGDFVEYVKAAQVEEPSPALIRVMTIHKSKGLEFDVVILPELDSKPQRSDDGVYVERDTPTGPITGVYRSANETIRSLSPQLVKAHRQQRDRLLNDSICSLYVGMTRARHALHMLIEPLDKPSGKPSKTVTHAKVLREGLSRVENEKLRTQQTLYQVGDPHWYQSVPQANGQTNDQAIDQATEQARQSEQPVRPTIALPDRGDTPRRSWRRVRPSGEGHDVVAASDLLDVTESYAAQKGTLFHRWFERIHWLDGDNNRLADDETLKADALAIDPTFDADWLAIQAGLFREIIAEPSMARALSHPTTQLWETHELWRERSFAQKVHGQLVTGQWDRVVVIRDGSSEDSAAVRAMLMDYKTDDFDPANAIDREDHIERHRAQMQTYRAALATLLNLDEADIQARLLFVVAGIVCDV